MDEFLRLHKPSEKAQQRAKQAGLHLSELKETNPQHYKMLVAQNVLEVSAELEQLASSVILAAFQHHEVFRLEQPHVITLLIFPELSTKELERLDKSLGQLLESASLKSNYAYFRVVTDKTGEHRQLSLPLPSEEWRGQRNHLIGPFENQTRAETWGEQNVRPRQLIYDTLSYAGAWFCDVFSAE